MWKRAFPAAVLAAAWVAGCSTRLDPPRTAAPAPRPAAPAVAAAPAGPRVVLLTAENTRVTFVGSAGSTSHEGTFDRLAGQWELPTADPKDSRLAVRIEVDSLRTKIPLLTMHLKRSDFLDAKQYPTATFRSTRIDPPSETDGSTHRVTGEFTIHGVTRAVTFPARISVGPDGATFDATFPVGQTSFGMASGAEKARDEVPVTVAINIPPQ
jgi:polyisoprenoid-binding protein YceI